jgi:hypothetical protein
MRFIFKEIPKSSFFSPFVRGMQLGNSCKLHPDPPPPRRLFRIITTHPVYGVAAVAPPKIIFMDSSKIHRPLKLPSSDGNFIMQSVVQTPLNFPEVNSGSKKMT